MSTTEKTPGQIAFEAYNESKGGRTYDGKPIPPWEAIENRGDGHGVKIAWEAAAEAAYAAIASRMSVVAHRREVGGGRGRSVRVLVRRRVRKGPRAEGV